MLSVLPIHPSTTGSLPVFPLSESSSSSDVYSSVNDETTTILTCPRTSLRKTLNLDDIPSLVNSKPEVVGHRGALYHSLENTLEGFQYCAEQGVDAIELDVFLVKGELIVFHGGGTDQNPGDLSEYCIDQDGKSILDLSLEEMATLQFNPSFAEFPCPPKTIASARIPTLKQVLELIQRHGTMICKIELKGEGTALPVLKMVEDMKLAHLVHFSSFHHDRIALIRQCHPERHDNHTGPHVYQTAALFVEPPTDFIDRALSVGASEVHLKYDTCTTERIQAIHAAGMRSMAWFRGPVGMKEDFETKYYDMGSTTADNVECIALYQIIMETGVQQMCCNKPDLLAQFLATRGDE